MQGPKYIETDHIIRRSREQAHLIHQKRLDEIKNEPVKMNSLGSLYKKPRIRPQRFLEVERSMDIKRHNQQLLDRIVEISHGTRKKSPHMLLTQSVRSLNKTNRKREAEKILNENELLAKRLADQRPMMPPKKKLDQEYHLYKKYRSSISRTQYLQTSYRKSNDRSMGSLPPIEKDIKTARTDDENRSQTPNFVKKKKYLDQRANSNSSKPHKIEAEIEYDEYESDFVDESIG